MNDLLGQHKRCGMATLLQNLISQLIKICKIRENKATRKFTGIWYCVKRLNFLNAKI